VLCVDAEQVDLEEFERLTRPGRQTLTDSNPEEAARTPCEALALWRGPALADVVSPFTASERTRLEKRLAALADPIEADLAVGAQTDLVSELRCLATRLGRTQFCFAIVLNALTTTVGSRARMVRSEG
jgi:hypothetical protein